jgi:hypothetical protein
VSKNQLAILLIMCVLAATGFGSTSSQSVEPPEPRSVPGATVPSEPKTRIADPSLVPVHSTTMSSSGCLSSNDGIAVSALDISNRAIRLLVPTKTFSTDRESGALLLTFDDLDLLKVLNMVQVTEDAVSWMPEWMKALDGKTVRIRGFMYPTFEAEDIEEFVLVSGPRLWDGCAPLKVYNLALVSMKSGTTTDYVPLTRKLDVVGRFKIDLQSDDDEVYQLFRIENASVIVSEIKDP